MADTFSLGFHSSFQHIGVDTFGKYHTLRVAAGGVVELAGQFAFVTHQLAQLQAVGIPVFDVFAGYTAFHGSFGHSAGHFGNEARVNRFRDEVFGTKSEVVYVVCLVHHIGHGLLGKVGNGVYGSNFHCFVDGFCLRVEGTAEDVGETDYIINLVRIVGTTGRHQYVRTCRHGVFVRDFRSRVGKGKHDGMVCHAANHVLGQHITF